MQGNLNAHVERDPTLARYACERWLDDAELRVIETATYWNDETEERSKSWFVLDGEFRKMEAYIASEQLPDQLDGCVQTARERYGIAPRGTGLDCACGVGWAIPILLRSGEVERVYAVEFSRHRLFRIAPVVLDHYGVPTDHVILCLGSFYSMRLPDASVDFALLAQALHHAFEPARLLTELRRVVRPGGVILVIGEHRITPAAIARRMLKYYARAVARGLPPRRPSWTDLFPPDPVLGDHFYSPTQYARMFEQHGFAWTQVHRRNWQCVSYVLRCL